LARYIGPVCRLCRREGMKLFLKGARCFSPKCPIEGKRNFPPGQHGRDRKPKIVGYGLQLREKQRAKRYYGVAEVQFRNLFEKAARMKGITGDNLLGMLERRLDNLVYRMHFAPSRKAARQLVLHGHVQVNGRKVGIPSYLAGAGDEIEIREPAKKNVGVKDSLKEFSRSGVSPWLEVDPDRLWGKVRAVPRRADVADLADINEQLIVELYSK
jgi:small subunit ribosomal protein S4